jgi:transglycosylase-like protein with SLT domain
MPTRLLDTWTRFRAADDRQLPLFPEWERARWREPLPSLGAALGLALLFAIWTPAEVPSERVAAAHHEPAVEALTEAEEEVPEYDLASIPEYIKAAAERHHLSEDLIVAVISVESNFDHAAVSQKGARGLMQLMPQTSALIGVRDPHSPDENIDAGASHLRAMLDTFHNDLPLALAAYNAGEGNVVRYKGIPPYPETRRFVARVLRKLGDKRGAEKIMARSSIPDPQWISRPPRPRPKVQMVGATTEPARLSPAGSTMIPATRLDRAPTAQVVLQDWEPQPMPRTWTPTPAPDQPPAPEPKAPSTQTP